MRGIPNNPKKPIIKPNWVTGPEAADYLGICNSTFYRRARIAASMGGMRIQRAPNVDVHGRSRQVLWFQIDDVHTFNRWWAAYRATAKRKRTRRRTRRARPIKARVVKRPVPPRSVASHLVEERPAKTKVARNLEGFTHDAVSAVEAFKENFEGLTDAEQTVVRAAVLEILQ